MVIGYDMRRRQCPLLCGRSTSVGLPLGSELSEERRCSFRKPQRYASYLDLLDLSASCEGVRYDANINLYLVRLCATCQVAPSGNSEDRHCYLPQAKLCGFC